LQSRVFLIMSHSRRTVLLLGASILGTPIMAACRQNLGTMSGTPPAKRDSSTALLYRLVEFTHDVCAIEGYTPVQSARTHAYVTLALSEVLLGSTPATGSERLALMPKFSGARTLENAVSVWRHMIPLVAPGISPAAWEILKAQQAELARGGQVALHAEAMEYAFDFAQWSQNDSYLLLRESQPRVPLSRGSWIPTPPKYKAPSDYFCDRVVPIYLTDPLEIPLKPPIAYSETRDSPYSRQAVDVLDRSAKASPADRSTARWWADGPFESATPVGHWMLLAAAALEGKQVDIVKALETLVILSTILLDASVSCFAWKYRFGTMRPVTYIRAHLSPVWSPLLTTPSFPEYPSGHSAISGAAAHVLQRILPIDAPVEDRLRNPMRETPVRWVVSWDQAAREASASRVVAGLHYAPSTEAGLVLGRDIATSCLRSTRA
jgi:membrane-associated phospholipid phosphatase